MKLETRMKKRETKIEAVRLLFRHSIIRHSDLIRGFELRHSDLGLHASVVNRFLPFSREDAA
jgi:hypothetical protein